MRSWGVAIVITAMLAAVPATASAATRYASGSGSGIACSQAAPCGVKQAIEAAGDGDTVELAPDEYNLVGSAPGGVDNNQGFIQVFAENLVIKGPDSVGDASTHVPFLLFSGTQPLGSRFMFFDLDSSGSRPVMRNVAISGDAVQSLVGTGTGNPAVTLDRVLLLNSSDSVTFEGDNATISNSVVRQTGPGASGRGVEVTGALSNSFVYSANGRAIASTNAFHKTPSCSLNVRNTIAWGKTRNILASTSSSSAGTCTSITVDYDYSWIPNAASAELGGGIEADVVGGRAVTISPGVHNLPNTPVVTTPAGAYEPSASSPAVNAGQAISDHDYYGRPRPIGAANDIGPYEATLIPDIPDASVSNVTATTAQLSAQVNPNGGATTYNFQIRRTGESEWQTVSGANLPANTNSLVPVTAEANLLQPATAYQVRIVATNSAGELAADGLAFRTLATPAPTPTPTPTLAVESVRSKVSRKGAYVTSRVAVSGAGTISQRATTGSSRLTTRCRVSKRTTAAGTSTLKCNLGSKGRRALKKSSLKLTLRTTFAPSTGSAVLVNRKLTVKRKR